jgi:hypothetical protein
VKAQVDALLHHYSNGLKKPRQPSFGVMDDIDYSYFSTLTTEDRKAVLQVLARVLITTYCHTTWQLCMKGKVFGENPGDVQDQDGDTISLLEFHNFPFVRGWLEHITSQLEETKFVIKERITSTGKLMARLHETLLHGILG